MGKNRRGQVTIFIIIAIVIVALVVIFLIFKDSLMPKNSPDPQISEIKELATDCIEKTGQSAIYAIGQNGGYYVPPKESDSLGTAYYFKNQEKIMPSLEKIEEQIAEYMYESFPICIRSSEGLINQNFTLFEIKSEILIKEEKILVGGRYPLEINKGESTLLVEDFGEIEIPVRLGEIYSIAKDVIENQVEKSGEICITCAIKLEEEDILTSLKTTENAIVYNIYDSQSILDVENEILESEPYHFRFLIET